MLFPGDKNKKMLRRMKYISDQKGIMNRFLAEGSNWENHLYRTRTFIAKCLEGSGAKTVAVLGSGWLLDLPFEYLRDNFTALYLVDIVHPAQIVNKTRGMENVHLVQADITGGAVKGVYRMVEKYRQTGLGSIMEIACNATAGGIKPDYIVSLNVLNQLDILLVDYVSRFMNIPENEKRAFRKRIQQQHIDMLQPGRSCLISDTEERVLNRNNEIISSKSLIYADLPNGVTREEWTWDFDRGVYNPGNPTEMLVNAIQI